MSILTFTVTPRGATDVTVMMVVLKSFESSTLWTSFCSYSRFWTVLSRGKNLHWLNTYLQWTHYEIVLTSITSIVSTACSRPEELGYTFAESSEHTTPLKWSHSLLRACPYNSWTQNSLNISIMELIIRIHAYLKEAVTPPMAFVLHTVKMVFFILLPKS